MPRVYGPKKQGPDLSWADDELDDPDRQTRDVSPPSNVPGPLFPSRTYKHRIRTPKPLTNSEKAAVSAQLSFRTRCREGPLFTVYDQSLRLVDYGKNVKREEVKKRAFNPFEDQDRWSSRHVKKRRTEPDLEARGSYGWHLNMFPEELWGVLDPAQKMPNWENVAEDSTAMASLGRAKTKKKKRRASDLDPLAEAVGGDEDSDEDILDRSRRKKRKKEAKALGERSGMEAEDDLEREQDEDDEDGEDGEADAEDSELEEDSDDENDDYNAENYFDAGDDDMDGFADENGMDDY